MRPGSSASTAQHACIGLVICSFFFAVSFGVIANSGFMMYVKHHAKHRCDIACTRACAFQGAGTSLAVMRTRTRRRQKTELSGDDLEDLPLNFQSV